MKASRLNLEITQPSVQIITQLISLRVKRLAPEADSSHLSSKDITKCSNEIYNKLANVRRHNRHLF